MNKRTPNKIAMQNSPTLNNARVSGKVKSTRFAVVIGGFKTYIVSALHLKRCIKLACAVLFVLACTS